MSAEEISDFLHGEELVPVSFLQNCEGLGFIVGAEQTDSDIPVDYHANIPFWLAQILSNPKVQMTEVLTPDWVQSLHPGANCESEMSYLFSAAVAALCEDESQDPDASLLKNIIDMCRERLGMVVHRAHISSRSSKDKYDTVLMKEEKDIIVNTQKTVDSFFRWKTNNINMNHI